MLHKIEYLLIALNCFPTILAAKKSTYDLELHKIACETYNPSLVKQFDCELRKVTRNRFAVDVLAQLNRELDKNAEVRVIFQYKPHTGKKLVTAFDVCIKICDALQHVNLLPRLIELMNEAFRSSNIPYSCPIKGNELYNMSNFIVTGAVLPSFLGLINFNYTLSYYVNRKISITAVVLGSTVLRSKSKS